MTKQNLTFSDQNLKIADLVVSDNVRQNLKREQIEAMKSSIEANGLLQNLIAAPASKDGKMTVIAGHTRFAAAAELIAEGKLAADYAVAVRVYDTIQAESTDALAIALTENIVREQMDYVDECIAMARLAQGRKSEEEIAAIFGYRPKTVVERLLIAGLIPEAHELLRNRKRNLGWARALTIADTSMQKRICDDIAATPGAWENGEDIRRFLLQSTIPANYALFDIADYKGEIVRDMFEGDQFNDIQAFWTLQNAAVDDLVIELEAEGWSAVTVSREPFQPWKYESCEDKSAGIAFVEVLSSGKVQVMRGLRAIQVDAGPVLDLGDLEAGDNFDDIAADEVRATPSLCDYAGAHRSAMVQVAVAQDFRKALEYNVLAMIGHRGASFSVQPYQFSGHQAHRNSKAFHKLADVNLDVIESFEGAQTDSVTRDSQLVAMVKGMSDAELQTLFAKLTSQRIGQQARRKIDDAPNSLMSVFGADIDIRAWWTPNEDFFNLMGTEDLRRLAATLLSKGSTLRYAAAKKKSLVRSLSDAFAEAQMGILGDPVREAELNSWVPGLMRFPAKIAVRETAAEDLDAADLDALLFGS